MSGGLDIVIVVRRVVDTDEDPREDAVGGGITEKSIVQEDVVLISRLAGSDAIAQVLRQFLGVGDIRLDGLDGRDQVLVPEELADVSSDAAVPGLVGQDSGLLDGQDVDVGGAASVVAGELGVELRNAVYVGDLSASVEGSVEPTLTRRADAGVDTHRTGVPDIGDDVRHGGAVGDVDELEDEVQIDTLLAVGDVGLEDLSLDPVRADSGLLNQGAGRVAGEDDVVRRVEVVAQLGLVVRDSRPLLEGSLVSLSDHRLCGHYS